MVQGQGKFKASNTSSRKSNKKTNVLRLKKGARAIAPKRQSVIKQKAIQKKLTSAINRDIEQVIASKAESVGGKKFNLIKREAKKDKKAKML
ncbi:7317_t:CDS:2 [Cetraspora pellucida]|uniref:7317_t:CDS:1 n=1 Tax=Cetraspora pellucida TaxID=1433469 RepID=A0A9N9AUM7_9GLOM|nr:7317_t:CDS:2 [Cetraspora pellucida]